MSRQIRITIDDDEVFERLRRRKDALDLSWEDALRRGLRDSPDPPRGPPSHRGAPGPHRERTESHDLGSRSDRGQGEPSPLDPGYGEHIAQEVLSSVRQSVPGAPGEPLDDEIERLEDAEDAVLVLGENEAERVPLRIALHTGPDGLEVEVVTVRSGKDTEGMNRFADGARAEVARKFARGDTVPLELDGGEETYQVRPELSWGRGSEGVPTVTDVVVTEVVFDD